MGPPGSEVRPNFFLRGLQALAGWTVRNPALTLALGVVCVVASSVYSSAHMKMNSDHSKLVRQDAPFRQAYEDYLDANGGLLVLDITTPTAPTEADEILWGWTSAVDALMTGWTTGANAPTTGLTTCPTGRPTMASTACRIALTARATVSSIASTRRPAPRYPMARMRSAARRSGSSSNTRSVASTVASKFCALKWAEASSSESQ